MLEIGLCFKLHLLSEYQICAESITHPRCIINNDHIIRLARIPWNCNRPFVTSLMPLSCIPLCSTWPVKNDFFHVLLWISWIVIQRHKPLDQKSTMITVVIQRSRPSSRHWVETLPSCGLDSINNRQQPWLVSREYYCGSTLFGYRIHINTPDRRQQQRVNNITTSLDYRYRPTTTA